MVKNIGKEMKNFIKDLKQNMNDPEELNFLLNRTEKMFDTILDEIEKYADEEEKKLNKLRKTQALHDKRMNEIENALNFLEKNMDDIYKDIYEEDSEFEIVCPYCNYIIEANIEEDVNEICCPECNNIIELDWSGDFED